MVIGDWLGRLDYRLLKGSLSAPVSEVVYDSRKAGPETVFVCLKGSARDSHEFIPQAYAAGCRVFVVEREVSLPEDASVILVKNGREALAELSAARFGYPAEKLMTIGITGTKGKTTTAHMIKKILEEAGKKTGMIGTIGAYIGAEKIPTKNTTPGPYELQEILAQMEREGCTHVVMEVSSQGLKQHRTDGIHFRYGAFLNISPDHIGEGEHADFAEYLSCKKLLFRQSHYGIINLGDAHGKEMLELTGHPVTFSRDQGGDYQAHDIRNIWEPGLLGVSFDLDGKESAHMVLNMPGEFNVENALAAISVARTEGIDMETVRAALKKVFVKGRTQLVQDSAHFTNIIIDYAHNALSIESLLHLLKSYHPKRLICVFGGGGNRPRQRRRDLGQAAGKYADLTILTMDNPRFEDMDDINRDIIEGLDVYNGVYQIIPDRKDAIHYVIDHCGKNDIVALIGKGHEEYQDVRGVKYPFSEEQVIREYLQTK